MPALITEKQSHFKPMFFEWLTPDTSIIKVTSQSPTAATPYAACFLIYCSPRDFGTNIYAHPKPQDLTEEIIKREGAKLFSENDVIATIGHLATHELELKDDYTGDRTLIIEHRTSLCAN